MKERLTIFLGDVNDEVRVKAQLHDPTAWLLDRNNIQKFNERLLDHPTTVYTSLGDLPKNLRIVYDILCQADVIFYTPPQVWSDKKTLDILEPSASIHGLTETLLLLLPESVKIIGLTPFTPKHTNPIPLVDSRKTQDKQLWVAGCSVTHGIGVETNERYGSLLANDLGLPCSFLSKSSSSISWAADQILRSDIRRGDLVIWGLTHWSRFTYVHQHRMLSGVTVASYRIYPEYNKIINIENLWSHQNFYHQFYAIEQVINYCKKIQAKLVLVGILNDNFSLLGYLKSQSNFLQIRYNLEYNDSQLEGKYLDLGTDSLHPGPHQHLAYKNAIANFIKTNNLYN